MRFYSINPGARYVIRPAYRETTGVHSRVIPGFRVEFHDHIFESDTVVDDEDRALAEGYLQGHRDFGVSLHKVRPEAEAAGAVAVGECVFGEPGPQGFTLCGQPVAPGTPYCSPHGALVRQFAGEEGATSALCQGTTKAGARCQRKAGESGYCASHQDIPAEVVA